MSNVALFHKAGMPVSIDAFKQAINSTKDSIKVATGGTFLKLDKKDGGWRYGADDVDVQEGSWWAVNPVSLKTGFIAWSKNGTVAGKELRSILLPPVVQGDLRDVGADWTECISMQLRCVNGEDDGLVVEYEQNSYGARKAFSELLTAFQGQLGSDPTKIVPVVSLSSDSYEHKTYGTIFNPIFEIQQWLAMDSTELEPVAEDGNADDGEGTLEDEGGEADEVETAAPPAQNTRARTTRAPVAGKTAPAKQPAARQTRAPVKAAATTAAKVPAKAKVVVRQRRRAVR